MRRPCVYIMASGFHGTLYIGVTSDLPQRVYEHQTASKGFVAQYSVTRLVWFEDHDDMPTAIQREKSLKRWYRAWKIALIEKTNPRWHWLDPETGVFLHDELHPPPDGSSPQGRG